jgi:hypothetical protein
MASYSDFTTTGSTEATDPAADFLCRFPDTSRRFIEAMFRDAAAKTHDPDILLREVERVVRLLGVHAAMTGHTPQLRAAQQLRDDFRRAMIAERDGAIAYAASVLAVTSEAAR